MKLRLNRYSHERAFRSAADFARFAEDQRAKFDSLEGEPSKDFDTWGRSVASHWAHAVAVAEAADADAGTIQQNLNSRPVLLFGSPLMRVLREFTRLGKSAAALEIMPFLTGQKDKTSAAQLHVIQLNAHAAFQTALALESTSKSEKGYAFFSEVLSAHEERLDDILQADLAELDAKRSQFQELIARAEQRFADVDKEVATKLQTWNAMWLEAHNAFVEQLATETAVKLWSARSKAHGDRYKGVRRWTIGFGLVGLFLAIIWIFGGFAFARYIFPSDATAQLASYAAGSLALFTLLVWGLRVLIRSMMSEDHLATDASARSALAHTYLALTKEEAATPEDRAIILATLFAPVSDGLVKDDGMPAFSPAALVASVLTNPGR